MIAFKELLVRAKRGEEKHLKNCLNSSNPLCGSAAM